jgi:hypothetical protein
MYKNKEAIVTAGNTNPTKGTKIDGRYEALIDFFLKLKLCIIFTKQMI